MITPNQADYQASTAQLDLLSQNGTNEDSIQERRAMIQNFPRTIGDCRVGSGTMRKCPRSDCLLDWAIIEYAVQHDNKETQWCYNNNHGKVPSNVRGGNPYQYLATYS